MTYLNYVDKVHDNNGTFGQWILFVGGTQYEGTQFKDPGQTHDDEHLNGLMSANFKFDQTHEYSLSTFN